MMFVSLHGLRFITFLLLSYLSLRCHFINLEVEVQSIKNKETKYCNSQIFEFNHYVSHRYSNKLNNLMIYNEYKMNLHYIK